MGDAMIPSRSSLTPTPGAARPGPRDPWADLEAQSDRPEVQEEIARLVRAGTIRVVPGRDDRIRIIPAGSSSGSS
jgi:hypothetical protein